MGGGRGGGRGGGMGGMFGGGGGGGSEDDEDMGQGGGMPGGLGGMFGMGGGGMPGMGGGGRARGPQKAPAIKHVLTLSLEDLYKGTTKKMKITKTKTDAQGRTEQVPKVIEIPVRQSRRHCDRQRQWPQR